MNSVRVHPTPGAFPVLGLVLLVLTSGLARATVISFDELEHGTVVSDQYLPLGVLFTSPSAEGAPTAYGFFESPVSPPNYLVGEDEGTVDLNPGPEFGNNELAVPITISFFSPSDPDVPGTVESAEFTTVFTNLGSVTQADAFGVGGELVQTIAVTTTVPSDNHVIAFSGGGIHEIVVTFGAEGSTTFEDHAGIDDLRFEFGPTSVTEHAWGAIKGMFLP